MDLSSILPRMDNWDFEFTNPTDPRQTVAGKGDGCEVLAMFDNGNVRTINTSALRPGDARINTDR